MQFYIQYTVISKVVSNRHIFMNTKRFIPLKGNGTG